MIPEAGNGTDGRIASLEFANLAGWTQGWPLPSLEKGSAEDIAAASPKQPNWDRAWSGSTREAFLPAQQR